MISIDPIERQENMFSSFINITVYCSGKFANYRVFSEREGFHPLDGLTVVGYLTEIGRLHLDGELKMFLRDGASKALAWILYHTLKNGMVYDDVGPFIDDFKRRFPSAKIDLESIINEMHTMSHHMARQLTSRPIEIRI